MSGIGVDVDGADLKCWTEWVHNVICAVKCEKCEAKDECLGCMLQRKCERVGVESEAINICACVTLA